MASFGLPNVLPFGGERKLVRRNGLLGMPLAFFPAHLLPLLYDERNAQPVGQVAAQSVCQVARFLMKQPELVAGVQPHAPTLEGAIG